VPAVDYFVSSALVEPADGVRHYSERLELLPESCAYVCYPRPALPEPMPRARFGLPHDAHLYVCPQSLFKLHPDFDAMIGGILRADPAGLLVLVSSPAHLQPQIVARWTQTIPDVLARVRFLPFCDHTRYLGLLRMADVVLDTPHFGGGNSSLEAIAMGAPVVTLPGAYARSRYTYANYRRMGMLDCVADSAQAYVDMAVRLGTDRAYAAAIRKRIVAGSDRLYNDTGTVRALEQFLIIAVARARDNATA
jgi:protein O-GlcNAc transferase